MIGYNESEILARIIEGGTGIPEHVRGETEEQLKTRQLFRQAINRVTKNIAKAIAANNTKIEEDLRKAGVNL